MPRILTAALLIACLAGRSSFVAAQTDTTQKPKPRKPDLELVPTRQVNLDTDEGTWISLDVSPDGGTIVFDLLGDLYTIPIAGGQATALTSGLMYDAQPRFSPDGKSVVFTSDRNGGDNVWTMDLATKATHVVTTGKSARYRSPIWTPDGKYVVVARAAGSIGPSKLWMYDKDGGSGIQLIRDPTPLNGANPVSTIGPAFGKDDRYLWYSQRTGAWEYEAGLPQYLIATLDRRTGRRETRANLYGSAFRPALSKDGKYLVYGSRYESQTGLRVRDLETGEERWLAYPVQRDEQESSVSSLDVYPGYAFTPDSKAIVVSYGGKIWRVPVDGSAATNIPFHVATKIDLGPKVEFTYPISDSAEFTVRQIRDAAPSPNERQIAFVALDNLYVMDYPSGTPRRLTSLPGTEAEPAWSPDGQWIAFVTWTHDGGHLYKIRATGGEPLQLTPGNARWSAPAWSPSGDRIVAFRASAQSALEQGGFLGGADLVWVPANGGGASFISAAQGRGNPHFVKGDSTRIYLYSGGEGLMSMRWDGTDPRTHVRVTGFRGADATQPSPAVTIMRAPVGDRALVQVSNDVYLLSVPEVGDAPTINLANPDAAEIPARKLSEVGAQFPVWSSDGRHIHWSIGHSHFVYDVDSAFSPRDTTPNAKKSTYHGVETPIIVRAKRDIPQGTALLRNARIVTMKGTEVIERGDILVRNNRIAAVGRSGTLTGVPSDAKTFDLAGKTVVPGFVDTHAHLGLLRTEHQQPSSYLINLAFGVTTTRDPQTGTTDVLSYEDAVTAGLTVGPRIYSTGPGLFGSTYVPGAGEDIKDLDDARRILRRYGTYYDTKTLKMYIAGNRQQRQWILMAAKENNIMPTTEGALDFRYDMTMAMDGYPGQEHNIPLVPLYKDVISLFSQSGIAYTPTLIVSYGGPAGENYWYTHEPPYNNPKVQHFMPYEELASKSRRRVRSIGGGGNNSGWFMEDEYVFPKVSKTLNDLVKAGGHVQIGSHGQFDGLGYHWEMWMFGMGGMAPMDILHAATMFGAEAIGLQKDIGSIEVGKLADLVVLNANPLVNIRNTSSVRYVMKNGRLYDGDSLDELYPRQRKMDPVAGTPKPPVVKAGITQP